MKASHTANLHVAAHFQALSLCCDLTSSVIFRDLAGWPWPDRRCSSLSFYHQSPSLQLPSLLPQSRQCCISIVAATWPFLPHNYFIMRPEVPPHFLSFFYLYECPENSARRRITGKSDVWKRIKMSKAGKICLFKPFLAYGWCGEKQQQYTWRFWKKQRMPQIL